MYQQGIEGVAGGGRCTLAFSMTVGERARSALSSTKIWHDPNPPMMTGDGAVLLAISLEDRAAAGMIIST